jgi:aspartate kinase
MLELASLGAGVMHSRSIEFAKKYHVPIHVRSSAHERPGTWIVGDADARRLGSGITGAALAKAETRITVEGVPDRPGRVDTLFRRIAEANIAVDMIVQNRASDGATDVSFTVSDDDSCETLRIAFAAAQAVGACGVTRDVNVAKVSVVGLRMQTHAGVAATMFKALAHAGVRVQMITTSEIKISALVNRSAAELALRTLHRAFELDRLPDDSRGASSFQRRVSRVRPTSTAANGTACNGSAGMEEVVISRIDLDLRQARITVPNVSDQPEEVAAIFERIASSGIHIDMIVKNAARKGHSSVSFTVLRADAGRAAAAARGGNGPVEIEPAIAKLSLKGVGMRSHTGVATRMFNGLASAGINVGLISTSEVCINIVTDIACGPEARERLAAEFLGHLAQPHAPLASILSQSIAIPAYAGRAS